MERLMAITPRKQRQNMARKIGKMMPDSPKVKDGPVMLSAAQARHVQKLLAK